MRPSLLIYLALCLSLCAIPRKTEATTLPSDGQLSTDPLPPFFRKAKDLGPADLEKSITLQVWLKLRNTSELQQLAEDVNDKRSPHYHRWIDGETFTAKFAPTAEQAETVSSYLRKEGFEILSIGSNHRQVTARASAARVQETFHVKLRNFGVQGKVVRASTSEPVIDAKIAPLIMQIGGLSTQSFEPHIARAPDPKTGKPLAAVPLVAGEKPPQFAMDCFGDPESQTYSTAGAFPKATYAGNTYGGDPAKTGTLSRCGYDPKALRTAYGINELAKKHLDGRGETAVIVAAYGSPTIQEDAEAFSTLFHLPKPKLKVLRPEGTTVSGPWNKVQQGWAGETTLDVEAVHLMATGAEIALVEATSAEFNPLAVALAYAIDNHLGNVITNSWGAHESAIDNGTLSLYNLIFQTANVQGIAVTFSSGDDGDEVKTAGYADVGFPASSPWVTAIGGTSLALKADRTIKFETGWGTSYVAIDPEAPLVPSLYGFRFGAGGGASRTFKKPSFQKNLSGTQRMLPDISYLADPFTGAQIVQSAFDSEGNPTPTTKEISITGGTSLASPMFAGLWSIANQANEASLGAAAPQLYALPKDAIVDIQPLDSKTNVALTLATEKKTMEISSLRLMMPQTTTPFYSAMQKNTDTAHGTGIVMSFGTDSTLFTARGWDNVTGLGTPNGAVFVEAVTQ